MFSWKIEQTHNIEPTISRGNNLLGVKKKLPYAYKSFS